VIIADQNADDRVAPVVARYAPHIRISHVRSRHGLSAARNDGLTVATGLFVAFPDDDCWYLPQTLAAIDERLKEHPELAGISVACCDADAKPSVQNWPPHGMKIDARNVWRCAVSIGIFLHREKIAAAGGFDESLGIGALWESGEETDLLLRLLAGGMQVLYTPECLVGHANPTAHYDAAAGARALRYGRGLGRVLAKHHRPLNEKAVVLVRPMLGAVLAILRGRGDKSRFYMQSINGRWQGLRGAAGNGTLR
jgi:glycosyltransferase involved in cell wall biosynthesis